MAGWTGYVLTASRFVEVAATFVVPTLNVAGSQVPSNAMFWVGLDGDGSGTVEQCGVAAYIDSGGGTRYQAWSEFFPADNEFWSPTKYPVSAGDSITATATFNGGRSGTYTLALANATKGWSGSVSKAMAALAAQNAVLPTQASAEVVVEADQPENVMADFGTITFTGITGLGSSPNSISQTAQASISTVYSNGSFAVTWAHA